MLCPVCNENPAEYSEIYGWLPCIPCRDKASKLKKPGKLPEFTSESIKQQRKAQAGDIIQPHRKGELSKEWLDRWGKKKAKERGFTDKEIKHAKNVWRKDETYYG